jgi:hypothetical protein
MDSASGYLVVWNPWFVRDCNNELLNCQDGKELWQIWRAWRKPRRDQGYGSLRVPVICSCNGVHARNKRDGLEERQKRESIRKHGPPVTTIVYRPSLCVWRTGSLDEIKPYLRKRYRQLSVID